MMSRLHRKPKHDSGRAEKHHGGPQRSGAMKEGLSGAG